MFLHSFEIPNYSKDLMNSPGFSNVLKHQNDQQEWFTGHLGNLYLKAEDRGLRINGSLPGFLCGTNFYSLDVSDTKQAFEKMEDLLSFSVRNGIITAVDIAQNLELDHAPDLYLSLFGKSRRTQPERWKETVYYETQSIKKTFYDKGKEMTGREKPQELKTKNLLRYELRYKKGFRKRFGEITPAGLTDLGLRKRMIDHWKKEYKAIKKRNIMTPNYKEITTPGQWEKFLMMEAIKIEGIDEVLSKIDLTAMDAKGRYRARKRMRKLITDSDHTERSDLINELDEKINVAAMEAVT